MSLLAQIDAGTGAHSVLYHRSKAYVSSLSVNASSIPLQLRHEVLDGTAATQTYRTAAGTAEIAVGLPIPAVHAAYFEVFDLSDLDHTLQRAGADALRRRRGDDVARDRARAASPASVCCGRCPTCRRRRAPSRAASSTRASTSRRPTPTSSGLTTSFNAMVDQLQERIEREARFNSDVSHELRSPLTTLSAAVERAGDGPRPAPGRARSAPSSS